MPTLNLLYETCAECRSAIQVSSPNHSEVVMCPKCLCMVTATTESRAPSRIDFEMEVEAETMSTAKDDADQSLHQAIVGNEPHARVRWRAARPAVANSNVPTPRVPRRVSEAKEKPPELTAGDWIVCILFPFIGFLTGMLRLVTGDRTGGKMLLVSTASTFGWLLILFVVCAISSLAP